MALSEFETKKVEKMVAQFVEKHRPQPNIRNKLDLAFRVEGQSVEIFEVRPVWLLALVEKDEYACFFG
jgi:hypothetical protein